MNTKSTKPNIPVFLFFLLVFLVWFAFSAIQTIKALSSLSWPETEGFVVSAEVEKVQSSKGAAKFKPVINYLYKIDSVEYSSSRYSTTIARGTSQWAEKIIGQYPANSAIKVYYDPEKPEYSIIERGLQTDNYWMTFLPLILFFVVMGIFIKQKKAN